jgi:hypothetical protein
MGAQIETLEDRRLLAASVVAGTLNVDGGKTADRITVQLDKSSGSASADLVTVIENGVRTQFKLATLTELRIHSLAGADRIVVRGNGYKWKLPILIWAGDGDDVVTLDVAGDTHVSGDNGADSLIGGGGRDALAGGDGNDWIVGNGGADKLTGGPGADWVIGGPGNDLVEGGNDSVADTLLSGAGRDTIHGTDGIDTMRYSTDVLTYSGAGLQEKTYFSTSTRARKMVYSEKYGLLFLLDSSGDIQVIDTAAQTPVGVRVPEKRFTDLDLSPSGDFLFAADFGGEQNGPNLPVVPNWVQRFDLSARTWAAPAQTADVAYRIEAVDDNRVLLLSSDQWVTLCLDEWHPYAAISLDSTNGIYEGDIEYDAATQRIIHTNSDSSNELQAGHLVGDAIHWVESTDSDNSAESGGGNAVLATDSSVFYYGRLQVEGLDVTHNLRMLPEAIVAASGKFAIGAKAYYDAISGKKLGALPFISSVFAWSQDGATLWSYDPRQSILHEYTVDDSVINDGGNSLPLYSAPKVKETENFSSPFNAVKLVYSAKHGLLFELNSGSAIRVIDTATRKTVDVRLANEQFTDIDLSPSEDYLYAADFGGEEIGYGDPSNNSYVQRFNLQTRAWEGPSETDEIAYRIEAVDDNRAVLLSSGQWTTMYLVGSKRCRQFRRHRIRPAKLSNHLWQRGINLERNSCVYTCRRSDQSGGTDRNLRSPTILGVRRPQRPGNRQQRLLLWITASKGTGRHAYPEEFQ